MKSTPLTNPKNTERQANKTKPKIQSKPNHNHITNRTKQLKKQLLIKSKEIIMSSTTNKVKVTIVKPTPDAKLGVKYTVSVLGVVKITSIDPEGLLASTSLKPGQRIVRINDTKVEGRTRDEVRAVFNNLASDVTIVARNPPEPLDRTKLLGGGGDGIFAMVPYGTYRMGFIL